MKAFFNLIRSENLKIYSRVSTWVMNGVLLLLVVLGSASTWEMGIKSVRSLWGLVAGQISLLFLINLFTIIIAGGVVANEYNWGTIKLLLIRPVSRRRILFAKYLSVILFGLFLLTLLFLGSMLVNGLLWLLKNGGTGFINEGLFSKQLWFDSFGGAISLYLLRFVEVVMYATIAFMLSTVSKSSTLTVGTVLLAMLFGPEVTRMFAAKPWAKYLLFANLDLVGYLKGNPPPFLGINLGFSVGALVIYGLIFYLISQWVFVKRDVLE